MISVVNQLASMADVVLPGIAECETLAGTADLEEAADFYHRLGVRTVVIKDGSKGAFVSVEGEPSCHVEGFHVEKVVDTVGAGDGFAVFGFNAHLAGLRRIYRLLLCLLLTLRQRDGALAASEEPKIGYRLSWTEREGEAGTAEEDAPQDGALPAFLTLPCFAAYRAEQSEEGFSVDLPIRRRTERGRIPILHNREERTRRVIRLRFAKEADDDRKEKDGATP